MTEPSQKPSSYLPWLLLSLVAPLYYGLISLRHGLAPLRIQDDARLHVVWLQQFWDSELFPQDLIAEYYHAIQAWGYQAVYWTFAKLGLEPLLLAKLLPTGLAVLTTVALFRLTLSLWPVPACGFWTTLFLNQNIWLKDDLVSATPRAFVYPLLVLFLEALVRQSIWGMLILLGLTGLFYPQLVLIELGLIGLRYPRRVWLLFGALFTAALVILPFRQGVIQEFGTLFTAAKMQQMPEFGPGGRRAYFGVDPVSFWLRGASGLRFPLFPPILWAAVALPWLPRQSAPVRRLLSELLLVSLGLFLLAHLLFPALYLPSRYTFYSLRVAMALASGFVVTWSIRAVWSAASEPTAKPTNPIRRPVVRRLAALFLALVIAVPAVPSLFLPVQGWVTGSYPNLYRYLAAQPKSIRIAALVPEADNLPAFAQRSVLVSRELALPYHSQFYAIMQQRIGFLLKGQYGTLSELQGVIRQFDVDFWLLDRQFADPDYLTQQDWLIHSSLQPYVKQKIDRLKAGQIPALAAPTLADQITACQVLSEDNLILLDAACLRKIKSS